MGSDAESIIGLPEHVKDYPRVSHVNDYTIAVKSAILNWAINMVRDGQDPFAYMNKKGDRGTYLHSCIESIIDGKMLHSQVQAMDADYVSSAVAYVKGWRIVGQEIKLWSDKLIVRGTCDYLGYRPDGKLALLDWKSGKPKRTEILSMNLYAYMIKERMGLTVDVAELIYLRKRKPLVKEVPLMAQLSEAYMFVYHNLGE